MTPSALVNTLNCLISLGSSWLWQFLTLSLFWLAFTVLRSAHPALHRMPLYYLINRLGYGRKTTEVKSHFHHFISKVLKSTWFIIADVDLDDLVDVMFARFLHVKSLPPHFYSLEGSHYAQLTLMEQEVIPLPLLEGCISTQIIWKSSAREICPFSPIY